MSTAIEILSELERRGVSISATGGSLTLGPKRALDAELLARVRSAKPELLKILAAPPVTCGSPDCAGCYDVGDGRKIHPPKCGEDYRAWLERWEAKGRPQ